MSLKLINGPINVVRLEGHVGSVRKVIYLFMDTHNEEKLQSKCASDVAQDIVDYLKNNFSQLRNSDKIVDFFMESNPSSHVIDIEKTRYFDVINTNMYIERVYKFFRELFKYDTSINKIKLSDMFNNVRLHYVDIRDWIEHFFSIIGASVYPKYDEKMVNIFTEMIKYIEFLRDSIVHPKKIHDEKFLVEELPNKIHISDTVGTAKVKNKIKYLIFKILKSYKHKDVQEIIEKYITKIIVAHLDFHINSFKNDPIFEDMRNYLNDFNEKKSKDEQNEFLIKIWDKYWDMVNSVSLDSFIMIMDVYFLRRFLDKDYITNAVVYTGSAHSLNYINILVNLFDFRVTHASFFIMPDIDELNAAIKSYHPYNFDHNRFHGVLDYGEFIYYGMQIIFSINGSRVAQCSNITNFPTNFE